MEIASNKLTRMMHNIEKVISWYNAKYNFQIDQASARERIEYNSLIERWDLLKSKRDSLKIK